MRSLLGHAIVLDCEGNDVTNIMVNGSKKAYETCNCLGIRKEYLKSNSPTCGCGRIYDGTFSGSSICGDGIFTSMLKQNGVEVVSI